MRDLLIGLANGATASCHCGLQVHVSYVTCPVAVDVCRVLRVMGRSSYLCQQGMKSGRPYCLPLVQML